MVDLKGGPHGLGATDLVERMYNRFVDLRNLEDIEMGNLCGKRIKLASLE